MAFGEILPTVKVQFKSGKFAGRWVQINESDFDPAKHSKEEIKVEPKVEDKPKMGRPKKSNNIDSYSPTLSSKK